MATRKQRIGKIAPPGIRDKHRKRPRVRPSTSGSVRRSVYLNLFGVNFKYEVVLRGKSSATAQAFRFLLIDQYLTAGIALGIVIALATALSNK